MDTPYAATPAAQKRWEPVVQGFAVAYTDTHQRNRGHWLAALRPYLNHVVIDELAATDIDEVPAGHYSGYTILTQADETLTVRVTYREGWALTVYITATGPNRWTVDTFDRADSDRS